jgi:hypothetical protein
MADPGRPSAYTAEVAKEICRRLAEGESLTAICKDAHMPARSTVSLWVVDNREGFSDEYARARDQGLDRMADEVMEIADGASEDVQRDRLRFDARRWYLSKLAPKRYGDKVTQVHEGGDPDKPIVQRIERVVVDPITEVGVMLIAPVAVPDAMADRVAERLKDLAAREAPNPDP